MHAMRGRPEAAERHGAGHVARCTARATHVRPGPTRRPPRQVPAHHAQRTARAVPGRPRQAPLRGVCPGWAVGRRHSPASGRYPLLVRAFSGWAYVTFVTDVYSRRIISWQTSTSLYTDLALTGLVHHLRPSGAVPVHSLRGCPGRLRGSRLGWVEGRPPFGFALAEALNSLYKGRADPQPGPLEGHRRRPCSPPPSGSTGTGTTRPHSAIGMPTPAEHEAAWAHDRHRQEQSQPATTGTR